MALNRKLIYALALPIVGSIAIIGTGFAAWVFNESFIQQENAGYTIEPSLSFTTLKAETDDKLKLDQNKDVGTIHIDLTFSYTMNAGYSSELSDAVVSNDVEAISEAELDFKVSLTTNDLAKYIVPESDVVEGKLTLSDFTDGLHEVKSFAEFHFVWTENKPKLHQDYLKMTEECQQGKIVFTSEITDGTVK